MSLAAWCNLSIQALLVVHVSTHPAKWQPEAFPNEADEVGGAGRLVRRREK
ncbi:hypothetical protein [Photorhabdus luminescens]|uniref:hypothetical protein n=1 Tax=Photorhabdus luminescens TaxID=29488 RepID=UPI001595DDA7|nr:hypothetical protein [Photorhabdus luminescens]